MTKLVGVLIVVLLGSIGSTMYFKSRMDTEISRKETILEVQEQLKKDIRDREISIAKLQQEVKTRKVIEENLDFIRQDVINAIDRNNKINDNLMTSIKKLDEEVPYEQCFDAKIPDGASGLLGFKSILDPGLR